MYTKHVKGPRNVPNIPHFILQRRHFGDTFLCFLSAKGSRKIKSVTEIFVLPVDIVLDQE